MKISVVVYKAFVSDRGGGNPAGIVFSETPFRVDEMQATAGEMALSETAFITPCGHTCFRLRYFTPLREVPLCGHATIAAWTWLAREKNIPPGIYTQETDSGSLAIEVTEQGDIFMEQAPPSFGPEVDGEEIAESLGLPGGSLHERYPVQLVSTGLPDIIVPLADLSLLARIRPDFKKIETLSQKYKCVGYHVFAFGERETLAHCRNFAPAVGILEEAATGTASGALAVYLARYHFPDQRDLDLTFLQGAEMGEPSTIRARIIQGELRVGGKALYSETRTITL